MTMPSLPRAARAHLQNVRTSRSIIRRSRPGRGLPASATGGSGRFLATAVAVLVLLVAGPARGASRLEERLRPLIEAHDGTVAISVKHLKTGEAFAHHETRPMPTASLIKLAVLVEAYRQADAGNLDLERMLVLRDEDKVPGSGVLTPHFSEGMRLSVRDAIRLMIVHSDNTATNLVLDEIGLESVSKSMESLGLPNTKMHAKVFRAESSIFPERSREFGLGSSTPGEIIGLLERLYRRELVSKRASEAMLEHLYACEGRNKIVRFLPAGTKVAHKGGSVSKSRCDAAIIESPGGPIAVCVMTTDNADRRWVPDNAGDRLCAEVGRAVYAHFNPAPERAEAAGADGLKRGDAGRLVVSLQRALNGRVKPTPALALDGEFGPATEAALVRFQQERGIAAKGIVDAETWKALGPLDDHILPPEVVNGLKLPEIPRESLDGPPAVTCSAWAIGDAKTGKVLWGQRANEPRHIASTTKMMTAYVVIRLAEADPVVLDEIVTVSERAARTVGSSAELRRGETLPVRELLYGLMLPSGNDASVVVGEHFGSRFEPPPENGDETDPLARFIAEMNRTAKRLGMDSAHYMNTHGMTHRRHRVSAAHLFVLARAAMQSRLFRQYVGTRYRGCLVSGPGGYRRHAFWTNTNQLLQVDGHDGVKTGTTSAAGACLVSSGRRGDDHLIVVVLGSQSSSARYVDSRNLFRWAWRQRRQGR